MFSVIMAGGVGTRFWPCSRRKHPKQLLDLTGGGSMIRLTVERLSGLSSPEEIFIITNRSQAKAIRAEVAGGVSPGNIISEPVGRNTSAAIGLAGVLLRRIDPDSRMLVLPADHLIEPVAAFEKAVRAAEAYVADRGGFLTFGIQPTRPETGYGYIQAGARVFSHSGLDVFAAEAFLEKPDPPTAERFFETGTYFWNSGMFMWNTDEILEAIERFIPDLYAVFVDVDERLGSENLAEILDDVYPQAPDISIDYGVMERADQVVVLRPDFSWNDVGSWEYLRDLHPPDAHGNVSIGDHVLIDSSGNTIYSPDRLIGVMGVDELAVIDAGDAILICPRQRVQEVRRIVDRLKDTGREEYY
jgi:mannose-1-phosphate guanylyltransferase